VPLADWNRSVSPEGRAIVMNVFELNVEVMYIRLIGWVLGG
jgi:hypothetical protein